MKLNIGDPAPNFTLKNHMMENVSLSDFKGKQNVVILFFPLVNTPPCEKELCSTRDGLLDYQSLNAQILAISVDSSFAQKLWADKHKFNFPLLSDFNKEVCKLYGAYYDLFAPGKFDYIGVAKRSAFVVDKDGLLRHIEILENSGDLPDFEAIQKALEKLQ